MYFKNVMACCTVCIFILYICICIFMHMHTIVMYVLCMYMYIYYRVLKEYYYAYCREENVSNNVYHQITFSHVFHDFTTTAVSTKLTTHKCAETTPYSGSLINVETPVASLPRPIQILPQFFPAHASAPELLDSNCRSQFFSV